MAKPFDASFLISAVFVIAAVALAIAAVVNPSLPVIGSGRWALLAVGAIGMVGCTLGGLSEAPTLGWTHPVIIIGSALGVVALAIIAAGLFGWDGILRPVVESLPGGQIASGASTQQLAIFALAVLIVVKWTIGIVFDMTRTISLA